MENSKKFSTDNLSLLDIIVIACFISLVFSPVGIGLMWWKSKWSKKTKIIISGCFGIVLAGIIALLVFLNSEPQAGAGGGAPFFGIEKEYDGGGGNGGKGSEYKPKKSSSKSKGNGSSQSNAQVSEQSFIEKAGESRVTYILLFILIMVILIVWRNLKGGNRGVSENPYVDTNKYKIPVPDGFEFPQVHYTKITLQPDEKILYATTAEQKANAGDIVVTNKRFIFVSKKDPLDMALGELSSISSMSNTTLLVNSGDKAFYFFVQDTQMRFVLAITRWAYEKIYGESE